MILLGSKYATNMNENRWFYVDRVKVCARVANRMPVSAARVMLVMVPMR